MTPFEVSEIITATGIVVGGAVGFSQILIKLGRMSEKFDTLFADKETVGSLAHARQESADRMERLEARLDGVVVRVDAAARSKKSRGQPGF